MRHLFGSLALAVVIGCSSYAPSGGGDPTTSGGGGAGADTSGKGGAKGAPTWSTVYAAYLGGGTIGHCGSCHGQASDAQGAYSFLVGAGYIGGAQSTVTSLFSWLGGPMPPGGPGGDAQASADVEAWVAAGALEN